MHKQTLLQLPRNLKHKALFIGIVSQAELGEAQFVIDESGLEFAINHHSAGVAVIHPGDEVICLQTQHAIIVLDRLRGEQESPVVHFQQVDMDTVQFTFGAVTETRTASGSYALTTPKVKVSFTTSGEVIRQCESLREETQGDLVLNTQKGILHLQDAPA